MQASPQVQLNSELREGMYFEWAGKLWYVLNVSKDDEMAFVEDCKSLKVRWIKTALFEEEMKEVKLTEC